jgi:hypothetical protein
MSEEFPLGAVASHSTGIANMTFTATTTASTSYFLQQLATAAQHNATRNLVISPSFHQDSNSFLSPEEQYFHRVGLDFWVLPLLRLGCNCTK